MFPSLLSQVIPMQFRPPVVVLALLWMHSAAWAETCKFVDAEGRVIYSNTPNMPPKGATKVKCFNDPAPKAAPAVPRNSDARPANSEGRSKMPRVSEDTQKARDDERRRILEQELEAENRQLAQAKEQLASQEAVRSGNERNYERFLERVQPYRDAVSTHERNIDALKREISNLK